MADLAKYLPLSQRPAGDESGANSNWGGHLAATLTATADLLAGLTAEQWEAPSLCAGWRVRDVAGHIVWRLGSSNRDLVRSLLRAWPGRSLRPSRAIDAVSRAAAEASPADLVARIRSIAADKAGGRGRHGIIELTEAVVHGYDIARPLGLGLAVAPTASGAVALRRSLIAPTGIKAVLHGRTLTATDADWSVGRGPALPGTAEEILLFLFDRGPLPASPHPAKPQ
ncbi:maleylpyruvate isomerase family mycothiol-dependent enzyme [Cryobacterium tagatosivorans]|uniref:Maleylpyruvate isomerase family mycothiol-dependent enzyme n=1 Tax=Cryobacterium tagatosivorans TaxID=1259199 RepID=A0A4R8UBS4_9MICO|nr:maleylpyruvate isomerase family mycothiol-dependent enzyme [Cryobacterium tagatosivorans]TFB48400.1 maleylpyruvate isomerase family mycothiol-dependent enzyme [Cryobacterium tagatosivorans]